MSTVVIKNLPDRLHLRLKERAERNHRSMTKEVVHLIEAGLGGSEAPDASQSPSMQAIRAAAAPSAPGPTQQRDGRDALRAALVEQPDGTYINVLGIEDEAFFEELERIRSETRAPNVDGMFDDEARA